MLKNKGKNIDILDTEKETFRIPKTTNNKKKFSHLRPQSHETPNYRCRYMHACACIIIVLLEIP